MLFIDILSYLFHIEIKSFSIAQDGLKLYILLPQLPASYFHLFWHPLDFGQRFSLAHVARGCVCNKGITCSDKPVGKAVLANTDQTGVFPLKSATPVLFLHPSGNLGSSESRTQQLSR